MNDQGITSDLGKQRGLQHITSQDGFFLMVAIDHRGGLRKLLSGGRASVQGRPPSDEELTRFKQDVCRVLAPHASGVLLDPEYGAGPCILSGALPGQTGLLVCVEKSGYQETPDGYVTELLPDWDPERIRSIGASGAKLLVFYNPDAPNAAMQRQLVASVSDRCREVGLLFVLEVLTYSLHSPKGSMESMRERPTLVIQAAQDLSPFADVMKVQYPTHPDAATSREEQLAWCRQLDEACNRPWALLSEGVEMDAFCQQLEIACRAGASGFMAGRVLWREALATTDSRQRQQILAIDGVARLARLSDIVRRFGRPWTQAGGWPIAEAR